MYRSFLFFLVIFLVFFAIPAFTDDSNSGENDFFDLGIMDGLVVSAGRTPEPVDEVPAQIIVISAEDIAESGAESLSELLERIPGVRFSGALSGAGSDQISMRGFGENSHGRVLLLVDGNRINSPDMSSLNWNSIPLGNIERIEIMDGSASVQYGNFAVGGVINIITKRGGERQTVAGVNAGVFISANDSGFAFSPAPWGSIFHGQFISHFQPASWGNFSLSAENNVNSGYRDRQESRVSSLGGAAKIFLQENLRLSFSASYSNLAFQLPGSLSEADFDDNPRQASNPEDENFEHYFSTALALNWFLSESMELNLPLSYRLSYRNMDMESFFSFTDHILHSLEARPQAVFNLYIDSMPLRLVGGLDFNFAYLDKETFSDEKRTSDSDSLEISMWTLGSYLTARFSPLSNLTFSAGLRFDMTGLRAEYSASPGSFTSDFKGDKMLNAFVYEAGAIYSPFENFRLYTRFASLFRYPFVDELADAWAGFNDDLEPERGFNVEFGLAYQFEEILEISANVFFMALEDEIAYSMVSSKNENIDNTRRMGMNIGFTLEPWDFLLLEGSYSFVNAVFSGGPDKDNFVPMVPSHSFYGSMMFSLPFGLKLGPNFNFASSSYYGGDTANSGDALDPWYILGFRASFNFEVSGGEMTIMLTGRNLLDYSYSPIGYYSSWSDNYSFYPADGRSINISLQYSF